MKDQDNERMNETEAEKEIMPDYLIGREAEEATIDKITLSIHSTVIIISPGFATIFSPKSSTYKPG
ncbi:hypothetical protein H112_08768 [Trichophyton rubrum D6]|uniref:Uncharacterized protein n=3 Tax=Trichophyton TaxID=5550 RepID=F2SBT2_TRIRC|nr:uncharacterized protein TERG_01317 [Trichophyton rubrum CBS 118892]EZF09896.1 hypothetical protein H100_08789 [Trichophyton rubrum MR850]EZF36749.1 hypothetical protein H102_08749 [Trichophyton rubrum CBS 100081]EZF47496.1 hypothetical protein H103_08771 [Trichophyton rubrum CBS 288.86]EZF58155.1 hypothetical protein H104_08724 [Trichophyton rubrum CBS 289.86]EZF68760.1 hypothetical protein H105_08774 [Trichophyton soudanense CBS 452.61]EZF79319.1 hypothetical protein H110_08773 [Trichophy